MPITIKVQLGDKLYRLSQKAQTLEDVKKEMQMRFPKAQGLEFYFNDKPITSLDGIIIDLKRQAQSSLKLTAKNDVSIIDSQMQFSMISARDSSILLDDASLINDISSGKVEEKTQLPSEFYICYQCLGNGVLAQAARATHLCTICKGTGKLGDNHKYIQRIRELYENHFNAAKKVESIQSQPKVQRIEPIQLIEPIRKKSIDNLNKDYEIIVSETTKKDKVEVGKLFNMRFDINNLGKDWAQKECFVIECGKTQGKKVSSLKSGEKMTIELGPFLCKNENILEKTYSLFYKEGEELVRFGHKFGFSVRGAKKEEIRKVNTIDREHERIKVLKIASGSPKSEEYLALKLKSMGIDVLNLQMEDDIIIELIRQIQ